MENDGYAGGGEVGEGELWILVYIANADEGIML